MMMSQTSDDTMAPKAAPMITPTARSTTLPRSANFLNSSSMGLPVRLVDQPGMHHGVAHDRLRLVGQRHHRQPHGIGALAKHRERIFGRRRIGFDEQMLMQRHQLVLQLERSRVVAFE